MASQPEISKQFLSRLTHHVRNPFNGIIGFTDLIQNHYDKLGDEDKLNYLQIVHQLSKKALLRSENLAWWLKYFTNNVQPVPQPFDLGELLKEELANLSHEFEKHRFDVEQEIEIGVIVNTDKVMVQNMVKNILLNLVEFTPASDNVDIHLTKANNQAVLVVKNHVKSAPTEETLQFLKQTFTEPDLTRMPETPGLWAITSLGLTLGLQVTINLTDSLATVTVVFPLS